MAGRGGGRGGRGGGRWGGRGSVTHDLIRDNLEDLGIDSFNHQEDRSPPPLYPYVDLTVPELPDPSSSSLYGVKKQDELVTRLKQSDCFLSRKSKGKPGNSNTEVDRNLTLTFSRAGVPTEWTKYAPHELFETSGIKSKAKGKSIDLNALQNMEEKSGAKEGAPAEKKEGEVSDEEAEEENPDEMEDDDYMVDHYASEGENDYGDEGGDDHEATF